MNDNPTKADVADSGGPTIPKPASRPRVLIIDDDQDVAEGTAEILVESGFLVKTALTAQQAVEAARHFDAQIALVDMNLGHGGNGLNLIPALRDLRPRLVTVVVSAYRSQPALDAATRSGAHGYLHKPFFPRELFMVLDRSIERRRAQERTPHQAGTNQAA